MSQDGFRACDLGGVTGNRVESVCGLAPESRAILPLSDLTGNLEIESKTQRDSGNLVVYCSSRGIVPATSPIVPSGPLRSIAFPRPRSRRA